MKKQLFTYYDSEAGQQTTYFTSLSEMVKYIEEFGWHGDSHGVVYADNAVILNYTSKENGITWS